MFEIGIDITTIDRFKNVSDYFIKRILTNNEYLEYLESNNKNNFLASRWSLKEAVYKSISQYINIPFYKIEFQKNLNGKVFCTNIKNVNVSVTYFENKVCAISIFLFKEN